MMPKSMLWKCFWNIYYLPFICSISFTRGLFWAINLIQNLTLFLVLRIWMYSYTSLIFLIRYRSHLFSYSILWQSFSFYISSFLKATFCCLDCERTGLSKSSSFSLFSFAVAATVLNWILGYYILTSSKSWFWDSSSSMVFSSSSSSSSSSGSSGYV